MEDKSIIEKFVGKNIVPITFLVIVSSLALIITPLIMGRERKNQIEEDEYVENIKKFTQEVGLGEVKIVEYVYRTYDNIAHYAASVSVDRTKPLILIKCRKSDNICWVVKELK